MPEICPLLYSEYGKLHALTRCLREKCEWYVKYVVPNPPWEGCAIKHISDLIHERSINKSDN